MFLTVILPSPSASATHTHSRTELDSTRAIQFPDARYTTAHFVDANAPQRETSRADHRRTVTFLGNLRCLKLEEQEPPHECVTVASILTTLTARVIRREQCRRRGVELGNVIEGNVKGGVGTGLQVQSHSTHKDSLRIFAHREMW